MLTALGVAFMAVATIPGYAADAESAEMRSWAQAAFLGEAPATDMGPRLELRRQDYGRLTLRKSVMNTGLRLADKSFARGLGTHSVSEIVVHLGRPGGRFEAVVGIDDNYDTQGIRGSVEFVVEVGGKEAFHSGIRRGSDPPLPVKVDLGGVDEFTLRVLDGGDGPSWDQSDWADAKVVQPAGTVWLDDLPVSGPPVPSSARPFSLTAEGKPVTDWVREIGGLSAEGDVERRQVVFRNAALKLAATVDLTLYKGRPAVDWTVHLKNEGTTASPLITDLKPLDLALALPTGDATLHGMNGSNASPNDFIPFADAVDTSYRRTFAPVGGKSSGTMSPFFNLQWPSGGLIVAIGWTGQWSLDLARDNAGGRLRAGQQTTHFRLNPGEEVRTPRIVLVRWDGDDPIKGHNVFRRLMLDHFTAKVDGKPAVPPVCENTWFQHDSGNRTTEANQLAAIAEMAKIGVEAYWLDAGWFKGGWPAGAGNWDPKDDAFPRGLKPLGDAAHKAGMKFVLWFEPERVTRISQIFKEHPQWVLQVDDGDGLFNLGDPEARKWLTGFLLERINAWGVDVYRNDFNIYPLPFWTAHDDPDRQGITEIRYVEGLYKMWDDLGARRPGLTIDNCASGGQRIDVEMTSRSYPLWQSDADGPDLPPTQFQDQNSGLSLYVPLHTGGSWGFDPYHWRSIATVGTSICLDQGGPAYNRAAGAKAVAETKRLRPLFLGDYYPLLTPPRDRTHWCAWQFDRPDLGEGFVMLFRREESPYSSAQVPLRAIDPNASYEVEFVDLNRKRTMKGSALASLSVRLDKPETSLLVIYRKK